MVKKTTKAKSHKGFIIFLIILIAVLCFAIFTILFPTKLININGEEILSTIEIDGINQLNEDIPDGGSIFVSVHYSGNDLTTLIKEQLSEQFPIEDVAVTVNNNNTIDLALSSLDIQKLFEGQGIPDFLLKGFNSSNIYTNISIQLIDGNKNKVDFIVNKAYIDDLSIPVDLFSSITDELSKQLEMNLNKIDGFTLQSIETNDATLLIDGVIK